MNHGTLGGYTNNGCRCDLCRDVKAAYEKRRYAANPERKRVYRKAWYAANPGYNKAWREAHPGYNKAYRAANPDKERRKEAKRRASKNASVFLITERDWRRLCARWDNACAYCGATEKLEQDHVVPLSRGGRHAIGNLLPACRSCNGRKHSKLLIEWRAHLRRAA